MEIFRYKTDIIAIEKISSRLFIFTIKN